MKKQSIATIRVGGLALAMPSHRSPRFAAGILALAAITIMLFAPSASAATPLSLSGETLSGAGTASAPSCPFGFVNSRGSFAVSGTAAGPYAGSFAENGTFAVSGENWGLIKSFMHAYFNATFTITSPGMLPITGVLSGQGAAMCSPTAYILRDPVGYTLTGNYSGGGAVGYPASGAFVNATFHTDTSQATISESFAP